jgi:UDP:flavonoid glycosyltransferase YjiC (YdhE family)
MKTHRTVPRIRVLILAEAVTLAHVARPAALAAGLDPQRFDVHFACSKRFDALLGALPHVRHDLDSISSARFLDALDRGAPVYAAADLRRYVHADLELLGRVAPDVVVGDFRLSLSASARLAGIAYATIANVYWSPVARVRFPLPELPLTRALGVRPATRRLFGLVQPAAFALHTRPLNQVRREHGLPSLGHDLRRTYTDADQVLYADAPELAPPRSLPPGHRFLGPVLWSPAVAEPDWWDRLDDDRPVVYVALGSSGKPELLDAALSGLKELPVTVVAAAIGRSLAPAPNAFVADFLPGDAACRRASVVVCNGGSPAVQQALAAGRPVVGLAANMDQHLSMGSVVEAGAGVLVRSEQATPATVARAVRRLLDDPTFRSRAEAVGQSLNAHDAPATFAGALEEMVSRS